jgi:hypothetical protein
VDVVRKRLEVGEGDGDNSGGAEKAKNEMKAAIKIA